MRIGPNHMQLSAWHLLVRWLRIRQSKFKSVRLYPSLWYEMYRDKVKKSKNYVNKKDLLEEIYKSREQDELTRECLNMLMELANRTIRKLYYKCEDDKQHALSEAYFDIAKNWRDFNPDYARFHGYETLKTGDELRVFIDKEQSRTAAAVVVENYPEENRIKLEYIVKKNHRDIKIYDKEDIIIKDPNPFSFFTSTCINGFAKGWKRLNPKKTKGRLVSIDSGYNSDGDGMHSL